MALGLGQIGEFSFVVADQANRLRLLPDEAAQSLVTASMISITINPLLLRAAEPLRRGRRPFHDRPA